MAFLFTVDDIRQEMNRLDRISRLDTSDIPIRVSTRLIKNWGKCVYEATRFTYKVVELVFSDRLLKHATYEHLMEVVRHEYTHAYVLLKFNRKDGHGRLWRDFAIHFGCTGERLSSFPEVEAQFDPAVKYRVTCSDCGQIYCYQRKSNIVKALEKDPHCSSYSCGRCRGYRFTLESNKEN